MNLSPIIDWAIRPKKIVRSTGIIEDFLKEIGRSLRKCPFVFPGRIESLPYLLSIFFRKIELFVPEQKYFVKKLLFTNFVNENRDIS
jgi:hypothetical protein